MSIVTKTGDAGTTGLMYNRRVPKTDPRVEACGSVDELNAAIGLARAQADAVLAGRLESTQRDLVLVMGELATVPEDLPRYQRDGHAISGPELPAKLEEWIGELEARSIPFRGWAMPGGTPLSAALDFGRVLARRAERQVWGLIESGSLGNREIAIFLNRLSDLLWLLARAAEAAVHQESHPPAPPDRT